MIASVCSVFVSIAVDRCQRGARELKNRNTQRRGWFGLPVGGWGFYRREGGGSLRNSHVLELLWHIRGDGGRGAA